MEHEMKKKRGREGEEVKDSSNKCTKLLQADLSHPHSVSINNVKGIRSCNHIDEEEDNNSYEISGENCFALGVFDFPWLKEEGSSSSMISKAEEEWCLEDTIFSSSLHYTTTAPAELCGQCLCETTTDATCIESSCIDVSVDKFEEINAWSLEMEGSPVDCTWTSLLQNKGD